MISVIGKSLAAHPAVATHHMGLENRVDLFTQVKIPHPRPKKPSNDPLKAKPFHAICISNKK
jgi:hypothetical protein